METRAKGRNVALLEPNLSPDFPCDFRTNDPAQFLHIASKNRNMTLVIDEAGNYCGQYAKETFWLATQSRHLGHKAIFVSQRPTMVSPVIRDNCTTLCCFAVFPKVALMLAEDFNKQELLDAPNLQQGEFLFVERFKPVQKLKLFS